MRYRSTRALKPEWKSFKDVLLEGLAPDGGLYMPESFPVLDLTSLRGMNYVDRARVVLGVYASDIPYNDLRALIEKTYTAEVFGTEEITPLQMLEPTLGLAKLSQGPTLAFKDLALQLLLNLMSYALEERGEELNILGATSGDTGSAAEYACKGRKRIRIFMLSSLGRMSREQRMQMYTLNEPNIFNLVTDATFDQNQAFVKAVNSDVDFKRRYKIGAVNSINWARIAAQIVYYFHTYLEATKSNDQRVTVVLPTGNFGNAFSAYAAREMGLPIDIIIATNENDVIDEFFRTDGIYRTRKSSEILATSSPSMDIGLASNFERFIFHMMYEDAGMVRKLWKELEQDGKFDACFLVPGQNSELRSGRATQAQVLHTIRVIHQTYGVIIDPHTAVGMCVGLRFRNRDVPLIVMETAQPAKFPDTIRAAIGKVPPVPLALSCLETLPEHTHSIMASTEAVKRFISEHI